MTTLLRNAFLATALFLTAPAALAQPAPPPGLDAYVQAVMRQFEVPGVSVAIVKDGQVVLTEGYGVRRIGESAPVDEHTLFGIASNTKAFTATALGLLVEEGKLAWDDPVTKHLPGFRLADPYVTREVQVRDLLSHRTGLSLGAGDLLWWPSNTYTSDEIVRRLARVPLSTSFRTTYAYANIPFVVAGEVVEAVSGMSYEDFVTTRIMRPLGMTESSIRASRAGEGGNVAATHARVEGAVRLVTPYLADNANAAAGMNANAVDITKWMIAQLDSGRAAGGQRLWSPAVTEQLWLLTTPQPNAKPSAPGLAPLRTNFRGYALGFGVNDYRGRKVVSHTGGLPGYLSRVTLLPELKLGVAVFTNQESGSAFNAITYRILDHYLGADHDWLRAYTAAQTRSDSLIAAEERRIAAARNPDTTPSLPLAEYTGTYTDPWYGDVVISQEDGRLALRFTPTPSLVAGLEHWQHDTFLVRWRERETRADAFLTFSLNPDGSVREARMEPASPAVDFSFDFQDLVLTPAR